MKRTVFNTFIFFTLLLPCIVFSQEFSVTGSLVDEKQLPISYANVILMTQQDSTIVKGSSTNDKGEFVLKNIQANQYILKVSFLGFEDSTQLLAINNNLVLEPIILKTSVETLSEVSIIAKQPTLKREVDRLVFNVANSSLSEGNMMEVLRSTPGVLVIGNDISIKNTTPTIFINDKKVHLSSEELSQLLENSPANSIKSVEVITNPPAKYDAESGAVLNIVMSKNLITGYRGSVFANYTQGVFPRYNAGMTNFYKTKKINLNANYSFTQSKINRDNEDEINFLDSGNAISETWKTNTNRNTWSKNHNFNFNFDYFIDDKNTLSLSSNILYVPDFEYSTKGNTNIFDSSSILNSSFNSNNLSNDDKHNLGFDLDYVHNFKNEAKLSANTHFTDYDYVRDQNVNSDYFLADNSFDRSTAFNTNANQNTNIFTGQLDYELPISETSSFSAGVKTSLINTESDITQYDIISGSEVLNTMNSDAFNYDESIYAAYLSYDKNWKKWSLSMGLRVEQTDIEGLSISSSQKNKQDYFELFPTFNLSYQLSEKVSLYTNYKRSVKRPNYQSLNPFQVFYNDNVVKTGNPNLRPSFTNHAVIGTSISDIFTIEAYYKNTDESFIELPIQNNLENKLIYTPTNLNNTVEYGFDFSTFFNVSERWFVYFVTSFYNIQDEAEFNGRVIKADLWSNYSVFSNDFSFLKDKSLTANFSLLYIGKNQQGLTEVDTRIVTDLSLKKTIFNKKGSLSLHIADLLNEQDFTVISKYLNQNNTQFFDLDNRYIKLGFSYKFGNTTLETNERNKEHEERDRLETKE